MMGMGQKFSQKKNQLHLDVSLTCLISAKLCLLLVTDSLKEVWRHHEKASVVPPSWQGAQQLTCRWHSTVLCPGGPSPQVSFHSQGHDVAPLASFSLTRRNQVWSLAPAHLKEREYLLITTCKDSATTVLLILMYIVFISSQWHARINA